MYVNASSGKLHANSGNAQFNVGTKLRVPVVSEGDKVIVKGYTYGTEKGVEYTVGGGDVIKSLETAESTYEVTEEDANKNGYVEIECTGGEMAYLYYVKVEYATEDGIDLDDISSDLTQEKDPNWTSSEGDGTISVPVDSTEVSYTSDGAGDIYFSFEIPDYAGTLSIYNTDIDDCLYTTADCSSSDEGKVSGTYISTYPSHYEFTGLSTSTKYYTKIHVYSASTVTICANYEATGGDDTQYELTLVYPTTEDGVSEGKLEATELVNQETTIKIGVNVYDEAYVLHLQIGENDNYLTSADLTSSDYTANDDGEGGYYTWTCTYEDGYPLTSGNEYAVIATLKSSQQGGTDLATATILTYVGATELTTATLTANPENGATITPDGNNQTISLEFSTAVNITSAQISLTGGNYENVTVSEGDDASTTWTLTVTDTQLTNDKDDEGNISIIIKATADGNDVYNTEDNLNYFELKYAVGEAAEPTAWSDIQIGTVTNADGASFAGEGITIDDNNIIVTFVDDNEDAADVTVITTANEDGYYTYVTVGDDETTKYDVTATNDDTADTASSWTLTLSEDAMSAIETILADEDMCSIKLVIVAQDDQGAYVGNAAGNDFPTYEGPVTASKVSNEDIPYTFETDPFSGEEVESLSEITVTISGKTADDDSDEFVELVDDEDISGIKVYAVDADGNITGDAVATGKGDDYTPLYYVDEDGEETDYKYGFTFSLNNTITDEGDYVIVIPEGFFYCGSLTNLSLVDSIHVTVKQTVEYELTFTPADGDEVTSLSSITITEANGQELALQGYEDDVIVTNSEGTTVTQGTYYAIDVEDEDCEYVLRDENGTIYGFIVPFDDTITDAGEYTITIPEEFVIYGEGSTEGNEAIKITVTVGETNGISSITLRATGDDKFYNISGQRVTSPRNGVFILNGKKVLVK